MKKKKEKGEVRRRKDKRDLIFFAQQAEGYTEKAEEAKEKAEEKGEDEEEKGESEEEEEEEELEEEDEDDDVDLRDVQDYLDGNITVQADPTEMKTVLLALFSPTLLPLPLLLSVPSLHSLPFVPSVPSVLSLCPLSSPLLIVYYRN